MCVVIVINKGEKEIQTPREFEEHFKINPGVLDEDMDHCLCHVDIDEILSEHEIPYKLHWGDYYVGMLDQLEDESHS
jgi:hypothetical protein